MQAELFANQLQRIKLRSSVLFSIEISEGSAFDPVSFKITAKGRPFCLRAFEGVLKVNFLIIVGELCMHDRQRYVRRS